MSTFLTQVSEGAPPLPGRVEHTEYREALAAMAEWVDLRMLEGWWPEPEGLNDQGLALVRLNHRANPAITVQIRNPALQAARDRRADLQAALNADAAALGDA